MLKNTLFRRRTVRHFLEEIEQKDIKNPKDIKKYFMEFAEQQVREAVSEFYNNLDFMVEELNLIEPEEEGRITQIGSLISANKQKLSSSGCRIKSLNIEEPTLEIKVQVKERKTSSTLIISLNRKETIGYIKMIDPINPIEDMISFNPRSKKDSLNKVSQAIAMLENA